MKLHHLGKKLSIGALTLGLSVGGASFVTSCGGSSKTTKRSGSSSQKRAAAEEVSKEESSSEEAVAERVVDSRSLPDPRGTERSCRESRPELQVSVRVGHRGALAAGARGAVPAPHQPARHGKCVLEGGQLPRPNAVVTNSVTRFLELSRFASRVGSPRGGTRF